MQSLDDKLEYDVRIGNTIIRKGCKCRTVILAARRAFEANPARPIEPLAMTDETEIRPISSLHQ